LYHLIAVEYCVASSIELYIKFTNKYYSSVRFKYLNNNMLELFSTRRAATVISTLIENRQTIATRPAEPWIQPTARQSNDYTKICTIILVMVFRLRRDGRNVEKIKKKLLRSRNNNYNRSIVSLPATIYCIIIIY